MRLIELEKALNIARGPLSRYERGKIIPSRTTLEKIAAFYKDDTTFEELALLRFNDMIADEDRQDALRWAKREVRELLLNTNETPEARRILELLQ